MLLSTTTAGRFLFAMKHDSFLHTTHIKIHEGCVRDSKRNRVAGSGV